MPFPALVRTSAVMMKELVQLRRDKSTLLMIVMIPIMQLMLFGYAINSDPKHMPTALLIADDSFLARNIVAGLHNTDYFAITESAPSEEAAHRLLQQGKVQFVISIPTHFTRDALRGDKPSLLIETDATDPTASSGAMAALNGVIAQIVREAFKGPLAFLRGTDNPFSITVHRHYNPEGFSRYNIVPGLMGIVLTMTGVMMTAMALTRERERGTMENLLSMPVRPLEVMAGKIMPYLLIGYIQAAIIIATAHFLFNVPIIGSLWLLAGALLIFLICNLALGFALSAGATNQMQAMQMSFMIMMPSILLSGFMFPFWGMPRWAQAIGSLLPATYFIRIVRSIMLKGGTLIEITPHLWPLFLFMTVITAIAMKLYRRTLD